MKRIMFFLIICLFVTPLVAQPDLNLTAQQSDPSNSDWELSVALTIGAETATGFFLQLPQDVRFVPARIESNGTPLWLMNAEQIPQQDSAVCWFEKENGLTIVFSENGIEENSLVVISGMLMLSKAQLLPQEQFQIKTIAATGETVTPTEQVVDVAGIPSPITK